MDTAALRRRYRVARRRERYRRCVGEPLAMEDVVQSWKASGGRCAHCGVRLTAAWDSRAPPLDAATLDRIDRRLEGAERCYGGGNCRWLCFGCNTERGAWEHLADARAKVIRLEHEVAELRRMLGGKKR